MNQPTQHDASASPTDVEEVRTHLVASLECFCSLIDTTHEHLDDCELLLLHEDDPNNGVSETLSDESINTNSQPRRPRSSGQKQIHRESMARLRQKLRDSITVLKEQEQYLEQTLRQTVESTPPSDQQEDTPPSALREFRHTYRSLVRQQIELQDERAQLEVTRALREKYERLVGREMDKARTFRTSPLPTDR